MFSLAATNEPIIVYCFFFLLIIIGSFMLINVVLAIYESAFDKIDEVQFQRRNKKYQRILDILHSREENEQ